MSLHPLRALLLLVAVAVPFCGNPVRAQDLVFDLSDHLIAITTAFTGTEVVGFGALEEPGDVVIVVLGPTQDMVVRRAESMAGIWINRDSMTFGDVPSFYGVATNRPIDSFASRPALERHGIGLDHLRLDALDADDASDAEIAAFRDALIRNMQATEVYGADIGRVVFLGDRLFRTTITFPASVPTGQYLVNAYVFRNGQLVGAQTSPLVVSKIGLGAEIFWFAQVHAAEYGMLAIIVAVIAGWIGGALFRRG